MTPAGVHSDRARPALVRLATDDPALGALALWCSHRDAPPGWTGGLARTDGTVIWYGPGFAALPPHEQTGVAAHHILHVALRHGARMGDMGMRLGGSFDATLYGLAADALVNEALLAAGHALPRPAVTLTDLLTRVLMRAPDPDPLTDWDVERLYLQLTGQGAGPGRDQTPSGKTATPADRARQIAAAAGFTPDLTRSLPDRDNPDGADQAALWRQHLSRAMEAGRSAGRGIGRFGHLIADLPIPRTPWEHTLRRLLSRALLPGLAQTHRRPARDWIAAESLSRSTAGPTPAFRPGTRRQIDAPRLVVAVDASGSVGTALLHRFLTEVAGIASRVAAEITLLAFDDGLRWQTRLDPARWAAQLPVLDWPRGGGTDFAPPIATAQALHASALVVLTDLQGPFGPPPRALPVIWASTEPGPQPPFGRLLPING